MISKTDLAQIIFKYIETNGDGAEEFIEAITFGLKGYAKRVLQIATDRDKVILCMMKNTCYNNPKMLEDVARTLSESAFNGQEKIYSLEETAEILKLSKAERKKVLTPKTDE